MDNHKYTTNLKMPFAEFIFAGSEKDGQQFASLLGQLQSMPSHAFDTLVDQVFSCRTLLLSQWDEISLRNLAQMVASGQVELPHSGLLDRARTQQVLKTICERLQQ